MFHDDMDEWRLRMMQADKAFEDGRAVWAESSFDDSSWGEIAVPGFVQDQGLDGFQRLYVGAQGRRDPGRLGR